jgi:hypothetical protein
VHARAPVTCPGHGAAFRRAPRQHRGRPTRTRWARASVVTFVVAVTVTVTAAAKTPREESAARQLSTSLVEPPQSRASAMRSSPKGERACPPRGQTTTPA